MASGDDQRDLIGLLSTRIEQLAVLCDRLREENRVLRASQEAWTTERANLLAKNDQARTRVEAMITRLKQMEMSS